MKAALRDPSLEALQNGLSAQTRISQKRPSERKAGSDNVTNSHRLNIGLKT